MQPSLGGCQHLLDMGHCYISIFPLPGLHPLPHQLGNPNCSPTATCSPQPFPKWTLE